MRVRVKFCGITRREDSAAAADLGADAMGIVFVPGTPRAVVPSAAREILRGLPPFLARVGVFADEDPARVRRIREELGLTAVQLHGMETPEDCRAIGGAVIKTFKVTESWCPSLMAGYSCEAWLLEAAIPDRPGVSGASFDWERIREGVSGRRIILAGGLTPDNVEEAIRTTRPYAVDVSRGIESAPGIKNRGRMIAFLDAVRRAET